MKTRRVHSKLKLEAVRIARPPAWGSGLDRSRVARAVLRCERVRDEDVVTELYAESPLRLLYLRPSRCVYQSSYGGGLVDGDALQLDVTVGAGASLTLKTQASTKAYRGATRQGWHVRVAPGARFVSWPDPLV